MRGATGWSSGPTVPDSGQVPVAEGRGAGGGLGKRMPGILPVFSSSSQVVWFAEERN